MNYEHIDLFPAAEFVCNNCGKNTLVSLVSVEKTLNTKELDEFYRKSFGTTTPPETSGSWLLEPTHVTCSFCNTTFKTFSKEMQEGVDELK